MERYVEAQWAKDAVREIDAAVAEFNKDRPKKEKIIVEWGVSDSEQAERDRDLPTDQQCQFGLMAFGGADIDIRISAPSKDGKPTYARLGIVLQKLIGLKDALPFRLYPREVFNVMTELGCNCSLFLCRRLESEKIDVYAVDIHVVTQGLTSSVFVDAVEELVSSATGILDQIVHDEGVDWWNENFDDDEQDEPAGDEE